jgi:glycosyltransferase involved in cell wall biosynthesis
MDKIAVVIPCFNEGIAIYKVVTDFKNALPEASIYVYDNNSTDDTIEQAKRAGAIVRVEKQQGKGNVIRRILREVDAECYLMVDGDDTYPAASARELCNKVLDEKYEMAIGDRLSANYHDVNERKGHSFGNVLVRRSINLLFSSDVKDILSGYRAMSYEFAKTFPVISRGFELETELTIHTLDKRLSVVSIPVSYGNRPEGSFSKLNTFKDGLKVLLTVFNLFKDYRPLLFFGLLALFFFSTGLLFLVPVLIVYFETGLVPRFPTLFMSLFLILLSVNSFLLGIIMDASANSERKNFEFKLILTRQAKGNISI